jgi:hypothetical protein
MFTATDTTADHPRFTHPAAGFTTVTGTRRYTIRPFPWSIRLNTSIESGYTNATMRLLIAGSPIDTAPRCAVCRVMGEFNQRVRNDHFLRHRFRRLSDDG